MRRPPFASRQYGLTLIEVAAVLAITATLAVAGTKFSTDWVYSSQIREAKSQLISAYEHAKALALRNPCNAEGVAAASSLRVEKLSSGQLLIQVQASGSNASCSQFFSQHAQAWQVTLAKGVQLSLQNSENFPMSLGLDKLGMPTTGQPYRFSLRKDQAGPVEEGFLQ